MERLDLELYADRLARHAERLADDVDAARLRLVWGELERRARADLGAADSMRLEALGVHGPPGGGGEDRTLIERRGLQLAALKRLQAHVERELTALRDGGEGSA